MVSWGWAGIEQNDCPVTGFAGQWKQLELGSGNVCAAFGWSFAKLNCVFYDIKHRFWKWKEALLCGVDHPGYAVPSSSQRPPALSQTPSSLSKPRALVTSLCWALWSLLWFTLNPCWCSEITFPSWDPRANSGFFLVPPGDPSDSLSRLKFLCECHWFPSHIIHQRPLTKMEKVSALDTSKTNI